MVKEVEWQTGVGTTTTEHVYDPQTGNLLMDLNGSNSLRCGTCPTDSVERVPGPAGRQWEYSWFMTDRLGSVIGITNGSGAATDTITYDGFVPDQILIAFLAKLRLYGFWRGAGLFAELLRILEKMGDGVTQLGTTRGADGWTVGVLGQILSAVVAKLTLYGYGVALGDGWRSLAMGG